jgi:hypothetical protein
MSSATYSPLPPSLPDAIMRWQVSTESEQNLSVSYLNRFPFAFADNLSRRIQNSGSVLFANASNPSTGGTFGVSLSYKQFSWLLLLITCNLAHVFGHP